MKLFHKLSAFFLSARGFAISIVLILLFATISRFYRLSSPSVYYFDEVYHALTSKLIARNDSRAYEWWNEPVEPDTAVDWLHPPLAKYTQAVSMLIFGENSFGWRFSSAFFGVLLVAATGLLAHTYFNKKSITLLSMFLVSLDGLLLSQSRIAMNDIHVTFLIVCAITAYGVYRNRLEKKLNANVWLLITGICSGLAMGTKWSGIYVLIAVWIAETIRLLLVRKITLRSRITHAFRMFVLLGIVPVVLYLGAYTHMFLQGKTLVCTGNEVQQGSCYCSQESSFWVKGLSSVFPAKKADFEKMEARGGCKRLISHFSELHMQIWWYQTNLKATHPYQSQPWQWILDLRPVWQYVDFPETPTGLTSNIYDVGNPFLFWIGLFTVSSLTGLSLFHVVRRQRNKAAALSFFPWRIGFLLLTYFIVWAPWVISPRIMFFYHYAPAIPTMVVLTAAGFVAVYEKEKRVRLLLIGTVVLIAVVYILMYPINTGLTMHQGYFDAIFKIFPSWK